MSLPFNSRTKYKKETRTIKSVPSYYCEYYGKPSKDSGIFSKGVEYIFHNKKTKQSETLDI